MKKILIPTDFSDNAWDALTFAIRLYDNIHCSFYILNTYQVSGSRLANMRSRYKDSRFFHILKEESESGLNKLSNYLNEYMPNDKHEYITKSMVGDLVNNINLLVSRENIDTVIMGTTGATGAKEIFMGSNAVKVVKHIKECPIISVPKKYEYKELEQVALATDLKRQYSKIELSPLIELQLLHNFDMHIIHVKKEEQLSNIQIENAEALKVLFDNTTIEIIDNSKSVSDCINDYTEKNDINMICLMNYHHSFIEKLTHEPILKKVSFHSSVPLMIVQI